MVADRRPVQDQVNQHSSLKSRGLGDTPLAEVLSTVMASGGAVSVL